MAVTRINTNQINDAQVTAAKIAAYTLTGGLFSNTITLNSNISVVGNFQVTGNTTTVNSVNTYVNDPIVIFNNGYTGVPSYDIGILVNRNLGTLTGYGNYNTAWIWDETAGAFTGVVTTEDGNSPGGSINKSFLSNIRIGNLAVTGALTTSTFTVAAGLQNTPVGNSTPSTGRFTYLTADTGFSTANAVISGGYISALTNAYITTSQITDFSTANAVITGGYLSGLANITATTGNVESWYAAVLNATSGNINTGYFGSLNTANAVITGGYLSGLANITATTGNVESWYAAVLNATSGNITTLQATNFSTGNAVITGGYVNGLANLTATTTQTTNFSTGNAVITGGYADSFTIGANTAAPASFTTANTTANLTVGGNVNTTGAVYAANIITTGTGGNISGVNYLLVSNIKATGNATASWFLGNFKGASGNLTTVNANLVTASYVKADNYQYANGSPFVSTTIANTAEITANISGGENIGLSLTNTGVTAGNYGSSTAIPTIVVDNKGRITSLTTNAISTTFNLTANTGTGSVAAGETLYIYGTAGETETSVSGNIFTVGLPNNINVSTLYATNFSTGNARISGGYADSFAIGANTAAPASFTTANTTANLTVGGNIIVTDTIYASDIVTSGGLNGNISGVDYLLVSNVIASGNITSGNITATGNIAANYFIGNGSQLTGIDATSIQNGNSNVKVYTNGNVATSVSGVANVLLVTSTGVNVTGNIGGVDYLLVSNVIATGTVSAGNITTTGNISGVNYLLASRFNVTNGNVITLVANNFSTANAIITGGNIDLGKTLETWLRAKYVSVQNADAITASFGNGNSDSSSTTSGAVTVDGGVGMTGNLNVGGNVLIIGNLTVQGNTTTVGSEDLLVTDSVIRLHTFANNQPLVSNDGRDIGVQFRYYDSADSQAFLGRVNSTGYLEWYARGAEDVINNSNVFVGTNYGTFKTGSIIVANATPATAANTGSFQVWGGASVSGNLYVDNIFSNGGDLTLDSLSVTTLALSTLQVSNFSTGNAVITGGYINGLSNLTATTTQTTNFSTANAVITGGYVDGLSNITATTGNVESWYAGVLNATASNITTGYFGSLNTGNAVISGGYINDLTNLTVTTAHLDNLSTGNAVISGGYISALANAYITTSYATNFSTGNAVITGGYVNDLSNLTVVTAQATNLSSGNVIITGGFINDLANLTATTTQTDNFSTANAVITGGYADSFTIGANTAAPASFTTANTTANLTVGGNIIATGSLYAANIITPGPSGNISGVNYLLVSNVIASNDVSISGKLNSTGGGYINGLANLTVTTTQTDNLSTANAVITGGYVNGLSNLSATTTQTDNLSTGNAWIAGGNINGLSNLSATTAQITNLSSGNAVVTGGSMNNVIIGNTTAAFGKFTILTATANVYLAPQDSPGTVIINPLNIGTIDNMNIGTSFQGNVYGTNFKATQSLNVPASGAVWIRAGAPGTGSAINNIKIGSTDPATGVFTTLDAQSGNFTTSNVTNGNVTTLYATNISSANVVVAGTVKATGNVVAGATTASTSTTTGALVVVGGAGIAGAVNIGTSLTVDGGAYGNVVTTQFAGVYGQAYGANPYSIMQVRSSDFATGMGMQAYVGTNGLFYSNTGIQFNTGSTVRDKDFPTGGTNAGQFAANGAFIAQTGIASTTTGTGAVIVIGGIGASGNLNIGGNLNLGGNLVIGGNINSASNIVVNSTKSAATDFAVRGAVDNSLIYAISNPVYDQVIIGGNIVTANVTQGAKLTISSTDSMLLPVGASGDRPGSAGFADIEGMFRYNSSLKAIEFYDGTAWVAPGDTTTTITDIQYSASSGNPAGNVDGINVDFILPVATTTNGCIVSLNGILQLPTVSYSVGGGGTTLTFTEAPVPGDVIDARILVTSSTVDVIGSVNGLNFVSVDNGNIKFNTGTVSSGTDLRWTIDTGGNLIPQTFGNIGSSSKRVNYVFASNVDITGGTIIGIALNTGSLDDTVIGGNIPASGGFTSVISTTLQVNSAASFGAGIYTDDSTGYSVGTGTTGKIASFDKTLYRSGKFFVQLSKNDNSEFQATEVIVVHNGTTPTVEVYGVTYTGAANLATFSANISGSTLNINASAAADVNVKTHPVLMKI